MEKPLSLTSRAAKEMEIYRAHWAPLKPPPFHHPGHTPTPKQLSALIPYQENYTRYWQSLDKFAVSPRLGEAEGAPYFKVGAWRAWARLEPGELGEGTLAFICHHKTGENLHTNIKLALPPDRINVSDFFEPFGRVPYSQRSKTIHLVRDPVDMILSGYRYHREKWHGEIWDWGHKKLQDPQCFMCDDKDHDVMFDTCHFNCTYFELLSRVDETAGAIIEAISARITITSMATTMSALAAQPGVLHLSFGLIKADAAKTTACMLKFLGLDGDKALLKKMTSEVQAVHDGDHATSGLHDDGGLKAHLRSHPVWGQSFREVKDLMGEIFRRQADDYGCPAEEA